MERDSLPLAATPTPQGLGQVERRILFRDFQSRSLNLCSPIPHMFPGAEFYQGLQKDDMIKKWNLDEPEEKCY